jgi:hypothetical protein
MWRWSRFRWTPVKVPVDTRREFSAQRPAAPAHELEGSRVFDSAAMVNTLSEFSALLERVNRDSRVVADGYFQPRSTDREVVRYLRDVGSDGKVSRYRMQLSADYAHMSEEAMRLVAIYEFNRFVTANGDLEIGSPANRVLESKLNGLLVAAKSLDVDGGYRDAEVWKGFLRKYNFPDISLGPINSLLAAEHQHYAGSDAMIQKFKGQLASHLLEAIGSPIAGNPAPAVA